MILNFRQAPAHKSVNKFFNYALPDSVYEAKRSSRDWYYQASAIKQAMQNRIHNLIRFICDIERHIAWFVRELRLCVRLRSI